MRIHLKILKTPLEKTRTKASKLIDELREGLVFQGKKLWSVVSRKILLLIDEGKCLFLGSDSSIPLYSCDTEYVILF
jgi:hypothetical protein